MGNEWDDETKPIRTNAGAEILPTMDELFEQAVDMEVVTRTQADALRPSGAYVTIPNLTVQAARQEKTGRLTFRFFGPAEMTVTDKSGPKLKLLPGTVVRGQFGFTTSPERANKVKAGVVTEEPDNASKLWAMGVRAFERAYQGKPRTFGDVVRYIQEFPVVLRVIQVGVPTESNPEPDGEPGNIVMGISPVREFGE